jgi:hypothetical protein
MRQPHVRSLPQSSYADGQAGLRRVRPSRPQAPPARRLRALLLYRQTWRGQQALSLLRLQRVRGPEARGSLHEEHEEVVMSAGIVLRVGLFWRVSLLSSGHALHF